MNTTDAAAGVFTIGPCAIRVTGSPLPLTFLSETAPDKNPAVCVELAMADGDPVWPATDISYACGSGDTVVMTAYRVAAFTVDAGGGRVRGTLYNDVHRWPPERFRDVVLLPAIEVALLRKGMFSLHASAVRSARGLTLFTGRPGGGKSTTAQLWRAHYGGEIFSDDRVLYAAGRYYSWPANEEYTAPPAVRLIAVEFDAGRARNDFARIDAAHGGELLLSATRLAGQRPDCFAAMRDSLKRITEEIFALVPRYGFYRARMNGETEQLWPLVDEILAERSEVYYHEQKGEVE